MTEFSGLWTTGGAGDGASTYTRADLSTFFKVLAACMDDEGVAPAYLNALIGSTTGANNARIGTGGALVDGKVYNNSAAVDVTIPSAVGGGNTRIDRVVLRADWTLQTVRVTRIAGTDAGSPTAPAITQVSGTTYDILLCQALVNTAGTVTITDERTFAKPGTDAIVTAAITDDAVTAAKIADGAIDAAAKIVDSVITAAKIANRTRYLWISPNNNSLTWQNGSGLIMPDGANNSVYGAFFVPADYVSGGTVVAHVSPEGSGNMRCSGTAYYGAVGEAYNLNTDTFSTADVAVTIFQISSVASISLATLAANDGVELIFQRLGAHANDTVGADVDMRGWLFSYTADS
jgi:hypothetical protein